MRQHLKNQCCETLKLLEEAHGEIVRQIEKKEIKAAQAILADCQQGAIRVGTLIEESEGEGTEEVRQLETYCEMTYQFHEDLTLSSADNVRQLAKKLRKPLVAVSNGIRNRIPTTKEIVFLPYKASMWDSLESVWRKAEADPDVEALVIPIPYYDKNPDGSMRGIHYEAKDFPEDVQVVDYRKYDLAAKHPEAIYIHNPYDDMNLVTSVLPEFYSSKLKEETDELVYIPYFVLGEIDPENEEAVKGVEHFITVPGVVNADRVVVQSEAWRQVYIDVMVRHFGETSRDAWEKKVDGSGSPKLERVSNLTKKDYEMPESWRKFVFKSDGSRKKMIFYNTGIAALLETDEKMLDKIRRNFDVFRENRDDVVLLWRPHPLIEATLTSMRPQLWEEYQQIVEEYRREQWGIYDDSAELDRAIALSDAYYGDHSSVVVLYQKTGKPIMIQNVEV